LWDNLDADEQLILYYDTKFELTWNFWHRIKNFFLKIFHLNKDSKTEKDLLLAVYFNINTDDK
jgi:hypothetical protein